ncbi:MAG: LPS-assembly lipoprotein [Candidatus Azotimanducaceae bacterium]|jgi:LPS-assembly lipoprotein
MRSITIIFLVLILSGCGFQLRGTGGYALAAESVSIVADNNHSDFADELEDTLKSIGVEVNPIDTPQYVIRLGSETTTRRPVASSGNITVSEYEVRLRAIFSISTAAGELLVPDTPLTAERIYSFDVSNFVSNSEEESILVEEMRQDLAGQLVRRFSATLRTKKVGATTTDS